MAEIPDSVRDRVWALLVERREGKTENELRMALSASQRPYLVPVLREWRDQGLIRMRVVPIQWNPSGQACKWAEKWQRYTVEDRKAEAPKRW